MPPPQKDDEKKGEEPPKDPPNKPADDSSAGKLVWLAAGAALMWLGGALHDAFNTDEQQKERANSYKQRKRVSSAWPDNNTSSSCANAALRGANAPGNTLDAPSNLASSGAIGLGADERTIPSFLCPITHEIMQDPVTTPYGHSYERAALLRWVMARHTDPMTNLPLDESQLVPAVSLRNAIQEYLEHVKKNGAKDKNDAKEEDKL